jgi:hypothetical protein
MRRKALFSVFTLLLSGALPTPAAAQDKHPLHGVWVAESYVAKGKTANEPPRGILIFFDSTYSFVAEMWPRKGGAGDVLTEAEKVAAYDGYLASSGSYELVGDTITTRAYIHLDPTATRAWPERTRSYKVRIEGDTLHWDFGDGVGRFRRIKGGLPQK